MFFVGNNKGQIVVFDEHGKALLLKQCRNETIFGLLDLGDNHVVVYYPGGNEEYMFKHKEEYVLEMVYSCENSGNYSIDTNFSEDKKILDGRKEGSIPVDR